ncbi:hypothetical protein HYPSUDRAFT_200354 [Hypholoma sublateritium FD-334 SS-4]|uniref:Uncharacterized protein n=1 Tax=Hypholoma sublateritium (strain FD-334 SS-4) TaxID=945553 RepID=A0A0D2P844_HYPSF|nr:hypothetical protein HYPSUDRAFT_200354 [Hypholoma sublateritium FD-334 SS-4]
MSATPPCTPIHNINEDVLLYIFAVNADMFADTKALHTTRITSQVCREWRDMMLNAPSLWARLIDMDAFHQSSTPRWWNELMKRSGTALLWIRAHSGLFMLWHTHPTDRSQRLERFFYRVVSRNWHRIQRLVIHGNNSNFGLARAMVSSPAPQLEDFEAPLQKETEAVRAADRHFRERSTACIFASRAPLLRRFRSVGYIADRRAPWLRYLHVIELDRTYNVYDALRVLSATRRLQEIRIADVIDGNLSKTLRSVSLPCLKYLKLLHYYPHLSSQQLH